MAITVLCLVPEILLSVEMRVDKMTPQAQQGSLMLIMAYECLWSAWNVFIIALQTKKKTAQADYIVLISKNKIKML